MDLRSLFFRKQKEPAKTHEESAKEKAAKAFAAQEKVRNIEDGYAGQLERFIAAHHKVVPKEKKSAFEPIYDRARALLTQVPMKDRANVNRHFVALFDKSGGQEAHWQLMSEHIPKINKHHREEYLRTLANHPNYTAREAIPFDEFTDIALHAKKTYMAREPKAHFEHVRKSA